MRHNKKAFTLVEMLVALAVSAVIVSATYASFELIKNQYKKNIDVTQLHTSGRAIMQVLEREIRMAGYEFRDDKGLMTYGKIIGPLVTTDSGNKCCDEVTIIYDEVTDTLNAQGVVTSSVVDRIKTRFWTEAYSSSKRGSRFRLYKRRTVLGTNNAVLTTPRVGAKEVMADYIEDLQFVDIVNSTNLLVGSKDRDNIEILDILTKSRAQPDGWITGTAKNKGFAEGLKGTLYSISEAKNGVTVYEPFKNKAGRTSFFSTDRENSVVAVDAQGLVYVGYERNTGIQIYDPKTGNKVGTIPTSINISSMDIGPNGTLYASNNYFKKVYMYNTTSKNKIGEVRTGIDIYKEISGQHIAFSLSSMYVAAQNLYKVKVFRLSDSVEIGYIQTNPICGPIAIGPKGFLYCGGFKSKGVRIYNPNTGVQVGAISTANNVDALAFVSESSGSKWLVTINLTIRTKEKYGKNRQVDKKAYHSGNFIFSKNDQYQRDTFSSTVLVRNIQ